MEQNEANKRKWFIFEEVVDNGGWAKLFSHTKNKRIKLPDTLKMIVFKVPKQSKSTTKSEINKNGFDWD